MPPSVLLQDQGSFSYMLRVQELYPLASTGTISSLYNVSSTMTYSTAQKHPLKEYVFPVDLSNIIRSFSPNVVVF